MEQDTMRMMTTKDPRQRWGIEIDFKDADSHDDDSVGEWSIDDMRAKIDDSGDTDGLKSSSESSLKICDIYDMFDYKQRCSTLPWYIYDMI